MWNHSTSNVELDQLLKHIDKIWVLHFPVFAIKPDSASVIIRRNRYSYNHSFIN